MSVSPFLRHKAPIGRPLVFACLLTLSVGPVTAASGSQDLGQDAIGPTMRLITQSQYMNTIRAIFGSHIDLNVRFPPMRRVEGLVALGAANAVITPSGLDALDGAARSIASQVVDPEYRAFVMPCQPAAVDRRDDACAAKFLSGVGRRLYRRPLSDADLASLVEAAGGAVGKAGDFDFYGGLKHVLVGMLLSPQFLLIQEKVEADPARQGAVRLDAYSKAMRLSFMLWDAAPDDDLLKAAESGALHRKAELQRQVNRMLASARLEQGVRAFFTDLLILEGYDNLSKDQIIYPAFTVTVLDDAREQMLQMVIDHLVVQRADYRDLFTTRRTMLSPSLAAIYGIPVYAAPSTWAPYEFAPDDVRAGFLTQIGFLAQHAHPGRSSPTRRGRALREIMLCQSVPNPPPNVDFSLFEDPDAPQRTARERLKIHNTDRTCRGCHAITDPIGLGLENFDGAGQFRTTENGVAIDSGGTLDTIAFEDARGLGRAVRDNPALKSCIVQRLYTAGVGRALLDTEENLIDEFVAQLDHRGYRWSDMLRLLTLSEPFFAVHAAAQAAADPTVATSMRGVQ